MKNRRSRHELPSGKANDAVWHEDDHPRGQPGNAGQFASVGGNNDLQKSSKRVKLNPKGKNNFLVKDFINKERRDYHVKKHLSEPAFKGMSPEEYVASGISLLESEVIPGKIRGYMEPTGNTIVRYDPVKQWYAVGNPNDGIWSLYSMSPDKYERRARSVLNHGKH